MSFCLKRIWALPPLARGAGFPLQSPLAYGSRRFPLQSLARHIVTLLALCGAGVFISCASGVTLDSAPPAWAVNLESAFPRDRYIAEIGWGGGKESAEAEALAGIGRYFQSRVSSRLDSSLESSLSGAGVTSRSSLGQRASVDSDAALFAVRVTEPWYNKAANHYEVAAYIDREEAWAVLSGRLLAAESAFFAAWDSATDESDSLLRYFLFRMAQAAGEGGEALLDYAMAIDSQKTEAFDARRNFRKALSEVSHRADEARQLVHIVIVCNNDFQNIITDALSSCFSEAGLKTAATGEFWSDKCESIITDNLQNMTSGIFLTPKMTITISSIDGVLYTWSRNVPRQGARSEDTARRMAYVLLAREIRLSLWSDFESAMAGQ